MECPKCGLEIDEKALVCPHCKKVLKLACPICKTVNDNNVCKKCGYVIISKCHNCGKINQTFQKKCKKCGFDTEKSVIMNEANSDDFVMMTIDFPNLLEMKEHLGSVKMFNKFKINLDKLIASYTKSIGLRRQLVNNKTYVIRFDRDYTFNSSVESAIKCSIELLNKITSLNCKLARKKNASIRCNMFLLKRNINDDPYNLDSGFNISLLNQNKNKNDKILNTFQIIADDSVSDALGNQYKVSPLNSVMVDEEMVMFYEVDVKEFVKIEYPEEEDSDDDEIKIPNFVQNMLVEQDKLDGIALNNLDAKVNPDAIYDIKTLAFEEIKCEFIRTENMDVIFHIMNKFQAIPKGIVAVKTVELYKPYSINVLNATAQTGQFNNIITLTCYDEMKYSPYSFFRELIAAIFEYAVSQKLFSQNDFTMFANIDPDGLIRDLVKLNNREGDNNDTRLVYFDIFMTLLQVIPKTLILIEDFDKIDAGSYDVLKYLFEAFDQLDLSFLLTYDKDFSLHDDCYFLLNRPYYTEIALKPATFEKIIENNKVYYRNILNNFYFQRVAKYSCGSSLFIDFAIQYLIESEVYREEGDCVIMINPKTIIIPSSLDKLICRRLNLLQDDEDAIRFLTSVVILGTRIDRGTIDSLGFKDVDNILEKLTNMGYIYEFNNCIYFPNYNLLRKNLIATVSPIYLQEIAKNLFEKVFDQETPSQTKAYLYNVLNDKTNEQKEWEKLAKINMSLGDYNAYINCTSKILEILDKNTDPEMADEIEAYKAQLYENISNNLYEYVPERTAEIAEITLKNLEKTKDVDKIVLLCNKMINGALDAGNYGHALELTHKVLSLLPPSSLNPNDENFNIYFFLMSLIHIQILFNIGALTDCLDIGYKVLNVVNNSTLSVLKPSYFSDEAFEQLIADSVGFVALANVLLMVGNVEEFLTLMRQDLNCIPESYNLFIKLEALLSGAPIDQINNEISPNDRFGNIIAFLITAFIQSEPEFFAELAYKAKIGAKISRLHQLELFCDLMIGYSYMRLENYPKADSITYNVIKKANSNGMTTLLYTAWYVMSELHLKQGKYNVAFGIANNSLIQLEKNNITSEFLLMLFKYNMYKIMMFKKDYERAEICIQHATYIASKYGINFPFDTNPEHYTVQEDIEDIASTLNVVEASQESED